MTVFTRLVEANKVAKDLEAKIKKKKEIFAKEIKDDLLNLSSIKAQEKELRDRVLEVLKRNNEDGAIVDDTVIRKQTKKTLKIDFPDKLREALRKEKDKIKEFGGKIEKVEKSFENKVEIVDRKYLMQLITNYENLEGKLLDGVVEYSTDFIMIK